MMTQTKKEKLAKLNAIAKPASAWREEAQFRLDNSDSIKKAQKIALSVLRTLRARQMSQVALAEKIGTTPQLVNKWLKGKENFTLSTIEKLEKALDIQLIEIIPPKAQLRIVSGTQMTFASFIFEKREIEKTQYRMTIVKSEKALVYSGITRPRISPQELCQA